MASCSARKQSLLNLQEHIMKLTKAQPLQETLYKFVDWQEEFRK